MTKPTHSKTITNSERKQSECMQKFFLGTCLGLVPDYAAKPLYRGTLTHRALEESDTLGSGEAIRRHRARLVEHMDAVGPEFMTGPREDVTAMFVQVDHMVRDHYAHWAEHGGDWQWTVLETERRHTYPIVLDVHLGGIMDKVVELHNQIWIVDIKTSSAPSNEWYEKTYDSQGPAYTYIVGQNLGRRVAGIIYDVINSREVTWVPTPLKPKTIKLEDGSKVLAPIHGIRKLAKAPHIHARDYKRLLAELGLATDWSEWSADIYQQLLDRETDGYWFHRIAVPFSDAEIERARREWVTVATELSWMKSHYEPLRDKAAACDDVWERDEMLMEAAARDNHLYPRAHGVCYQFNRECNYRSFCERPQGGLDGLVFRPKRPEYEDL